MFLVDRRPVNSNVRQLLELGVMKTLLTILLLIVAIPAWSQKNSANETDWQTDGLLGRVKNIRTYKTWFKKDDRTGRFVEGERDLEEEVTYDSSGNQTARNNTNELPAGTELLTPTNTEDSKQRTTEIRYSRSDGSLTLRITYAYDDKGRKIEEAHYFPDGTLEWRENYSLDEKGNTVEEVLTQQVHPEHFNPKRYDVYVTTKRIFKYDARNNPIEEKHLYPDGSLYATWVRTFDAKDRLTKEIRTDKQSRPEDLTINTYDSRGKLVEETHYSNFCYNRDGSMCEGTLTTEAGVFYYGTKTTYESDPTGNWIKQIEYKIRERAGVKAFEPSTAMYREITYY